MRGKVSKKLRRFAKLDAADAPWVVYTTVRTSHRSKNVSTVLEFECQRSYYQQLKRIWKSF